MDGKYSITKQFKFEAAHRLLSMPEGHPCRRIHGHSYVVNATIEVDCLSKSNPNMILDFGIFKSFQKDLDELFDHKIILNSNDPLCDILKDIPDSGLFILTNMDPTAEKMSEWLTLKLIIKYMKEFGIPHGTISIEMFETVGNSACFKLPF
ncbi:MAG: 6-carboxytetrahydropterin synthase [Sphaerochaetaceae bacterium]|nr:6-carboxytetrahydropterin synthase [Sphaerochaetaceae bacterium]